MLRNDLSHGFRRAGLLAGALLFLTVFRGAAAYAEPVSGVNLYLLKKWSNMPAPDVAEFDAVAAENRQRLDQAAQGGFKLIRILFRMALVTPDAPAAQRETMLRLMADFVKDANARGIRTIIAPFGDGGTFKKDLICGRPEALIETAATLASALPDSPMAGLEPLNEPPTGCGAHGSDARWGSVQQTLYHRIRAVRPHLTVVLYGGDWGSLDGLLQFDPSPYRADANVLFTFHDYEPFVFTRQGANWNAGYKFVDGLSWPYSPDEAEEAESRALRALSGDHSPADGQRGDPAQHLREDFDKFREAGTPGYIASRFEQVAGWARNTGIPNSRIFIGEFGALRPSHDASGAPRPGAANWLAGMVDAARKRGFQWAVFDLDTSFAVECDQKLCDEYRSVFK